MKRIRLYRNPACQKCARLAKIHHSLDWLNRFEDSTQTPPTGSLRLREIAVQDLQTLNTYRGVEAFRLLCRHIPLYWLLLPFTYMPGLRGSIARQTGCTYDDACATTLRKPARQS